MRQKFGEVAGVVPSNIVIDQCFLVVSVRLKASLDVNCRKSENENE